MATGLKTLRVVHPLYKTRRQQLKSEDEGWQDGASGYSAWHLGLVDQVQSPGKATLPALSHFTGSGNNFKKSK